MKNSNDTMGIEPAFVLHKKRGISYPVRLLVSKEGRFCMELVGGGAGHAAACYSTVRLEMRSHTPA
jgi:hypothetical protein